MKPIFSSLTALALLVTGTHAQAGSVCMPAAEMKASLLDWYGERPLPKTAHQSTQVWVSDRTGTWTMFETDDAGMACVLAQGEQWMADGGLARRIAALED